MMSIKPLMWSIIAVNLHADSINYVAWWHQNLNQFHHMNYTQYLIIQWLRDLICPTPFVNVSGPQVARKLIIKSSDQKTSTPITQVPFECWWNSLHLKKNQGGFIHRRKKKCARLPSFSLFPHLRPTSPDPPPRPLLADGAYKRSTKSWV